MMNRRFTPLIIIVVVLLASIIGFSSYLKYQASLKQVTITSKTPGATISVYRSKGLDKADALSDKNLTKSVTGETLNAKLKKGSYIYQVKTDSKDYEAQISVFDVNDQPVTINANLNYSKDKLAAVAATHKAEINSLINTNYGYAMANYLVSDVQSFEDGNWFGVKISPKNPSGDTFIIILKSTNGKIEAATNEPTLTISTPEYPDIPKNVIISTNAMVKDVL